ncbi:AfsR/SARP family transcriptional regulator [Microtetraspora niveoalba]|uniref:AfsR/SARP family transcriptional regulator n=1 Tax=Microtetraspora niveoalba TaxID=46175 RepID=UPI0008339424|nr:BTAD domain-containing putative transcriptional regulator [Microtetraspora niveoalba]
MRFGILGPTDVRRDDGSVVAVGGPRLRALLAMLLLDAGRVVTVERLIDGLYGTEPPAAAGNALQAQVSRLRALLSSPPPHGTAGAHGTTRPSSGGASPFGRTGPGAVGSAEAAGTTGPGDKTAGTPDRPTALRNAVANADATVNRAVVVRHPAGYMLAVDPADVDAHRFDRLVAGGREALASGVPARAATTLRAALDLWRGPAFADVGDAPFAAAQAARLDELRLTAAEDHAQATLALGGHRELVAPLQGLVAAHPLRERLHGLLMRALYASGRQAEALARYEELRRRLADELGADPSAELAAVHIAMLRGDPALAPVSINSPSPAAGVSPGSSTPAFTPSSISPPATESTAPTSPTSWASATSIDSASAVSPARPASSTPKPRSPTQVTAASPASGTSIDSASSAASIASPDSSRSAASLPGSSPDPTGSTTSLFGTSPRSSESSTSVATSPDPTGSNASVPGAPPNSTGSPTSVPGVDSASSTPVHQGLAAQITSLIGRTAELNQVDTLLSESRLVTLTGPGGTGKTRLALEAASRQDGDVCFVELAQLADGAEVPQAVLSALGLRQAGPITFAPGAQAPDPSSRLASALASRPLLLVLDNCEHVVDAAARLTARLLASCPDLRVLATSREALGITGERLCPVPPLALPPAGTPASDLPAYAAVRLFAERAIAVRPDFRLEEDEAEAAVSICRALDGLPLAIELAAARLRSLTASEVAVRLGAAGDGTSRARFELLSRGSRTAQPRHRTLRKVVEWSWDLLDKSEQTLARRLTVFAGGAALEAAERVCDLPDTDGVLASLVDKSLVEVVGGRYRMLETIRAFCAERLAEAGEEERLRRAHTAYFTELAETADPYLRRTEQLEWLRRLDVEHDNLHAALHRSTEAGDIGAALRLLSALAGYWFLRGLRAEGAALATALLRRMGPRPPDGLDEEHALCVLTAAATGACPPEVEASLEGAIRLVDAWDTAPRQLWTSVLRAVVVGPPSDWDRSVEMQYRLELISDDPWMHALGRFSRGYLHHFRGRPAEAERELELALADFRSLGERWGMVTALSGLADLAAWRGEWARSAALTDEALDLAERLDATVDVAEMLCRRAESRSRDGDDTGALTDYERAIELARRAGAPEMVATAHLGLGELARLRGDLAEATRNCRLALETCTRDTFSAEEARARTCVALGWISEAEGDADAALAWHRRALAVAHERRDLPLTALIAEGIAGATLLAGDPEQAALLLGLGGALRGCVWIGHPDLVRVAGRARRLLGSSAYESARARGEAMGRAARVSMGSTPDPMPSIMREHLAALGR